MFRERKNSFVSAMKLIQDLIIFSGFTVLVFCFVLLPIFWQKIVCSFRSSHAGSHNTTAEKVLKDLVRRDLMQYSFGEITGFVCVFSTNVYASTNFWNSLVQVMYHSCVTGCLPHQ